MSSSVLQTSTNKNIFLKNSLLPNQWFSWKHQFDMLVMFFHHSQNKYVTINIFQMLGYRLTGSLAQGDAVFMLPLPGNRAQFQIWSLANQAVRCMTGGAWVSSGMPLAPVRELGASTGYVPENTKKTKQTAILQGKASWWPQTRPSTPQNIILC